MRIPFDLIAAILCAERIGEYLSREDNRPARFIDALWVWPLFLFGCWFASEIAARLLERRNRREESTDGVGSALHPNQFYSRSLWVTQSFSVALFAAAIWYLNWPLVAERWPLAFGLPLDTAIGPFVLAKSVVISSLLIVGPYLAAMVLSWIPRRRLASGSRKRKIPLLAYLSFEAKLTWLPFCASVVLAILSDFAQLLPPVYSSWLENELAQTIVMVVMLALVATILMPLAAVTLWDCRPLQDGELKDRMESLIARSGVKTRAILVWGRPQHGHAERLRDGNLVTFPLRADQPAAGRNAQRRRD